MLFARKLKLWLMIQLSWPILIIGTWNAGLCETITVSTVTELENAVADTNSSGGNKTILLQDGNYTLNDTLYINSPNVIVGSQSGNRAKIIIQGDAMNSNARVGKISGLPGAILSRDDASGTVTNNITNSDVSWFQNVSTADLHLAFAVNSVVNMGEPISDLTNDFDGDNPYTLP